VARNRIDLRRIRIRRSYTIEELSRLLGCHKNTARGWTKQGLAPLSDGKRPLLFQGAEVRAFLQSRRARAKRKCRPDELFCFSCRAPRRPAARMVDYRRDAFGGRLSGPCSECSTLMFKRASAAMVERVKNSLDVKIIESAPTAKWAA
jgi:hypothetical protein